MGMLERANDKDIFSQASPLASHGEIWTPLAFQGIAQAPQSLLPPCFLGLLFRAGFGGQAVTVLTPGLCAQPLGHFELQLLVGATSGARPSPVALMRFHSWGSLDKCLGALQRGPTLQAFPERQALNRGEPGGRLDSVTARRIKSGQKPLFSQGLKQDAAQRVLTENRCLMILLQGK